MALDTTSYLLGKKAGGGGETPTGTINITENGTVNVSSYASADVNVQPKLESKSITINTNTTTTITPTSGKDGLSSVEVTTNVPSGGGEDWTDIGYSSEPQAITNIHNYSKSIYDNWDANNPHNFQNDYKLTILPTIDTSNITDFSNMFSNCNALKQIPNITVSFLVTSTKNMFNACRSLDTIDISGYNTTNVTDMSGMFQNCTNLPSLTFGQNFKARNVTTMASMFLGCSSLTSLNLYDIATSTTGLTNVANMFQNCRGLTSLTLPFNFALNNVTSFNYMFDGCNSLTSLDINSAIYYATNTASYMFRNCSALTSLTFGNDATFTFTTSMNYMFAGCSSLTSLDLSKFRFKSVANMSYMFQNCTNLNSLTFMTYPVPGINRFSSVTNMNYMFNGCSSLTSIDMSYFDISNVTSMASIFDGCTNLVSFNWYGSAAKISNLSNAFKDCTSLNDDTLNYILSLCANSKVSATNKKISYTGITDATILAKLPTLSNYSAFTSAGWTIS